MKVKVYVVSRGEMSEGSSIEGVFGNPVDAQKLKEEIESSSSFMACDFCDVEEFVVDVQEVVSELACAPGYYWVRREAGHEVKLAKFYNDRSANGSYFMQCLIIDDRHTCLPSELYWVGPRIEKPED